MEEEGAATEKERREWLKKEHGLGTNSAWWIAERSMGKGTEEDDPDAYLRQAVKYVDDMLSGKESLRPVYEELLKLGLSVGSDVKACPGKTIVPLYRNHVFAQKDRITHRIPIASVADIDDEVRRRLRMAYDLDA